MDFPLKFFLENIILHWVLENGEGVETVKIKYAENENLENIGVLAVNCKNCENGENGECLLQSKSKKHSSNVIYN